METLEERKKIISDSINSVHLEAEKEISELYKQKFSIYDKNTTLTNEDIIQIDKINERLSCIQDEEYKKYSKLYEELDKVENEIINLIPPAIIGQRVYLKKPTNGLLGKYKIFLKDSNELIGEIEYRGYHISEYIGDVGYNIEEEYRGNNYAYEALELLSDILINNGIDSFWISASSRNYASIKILLRYGGQRKYDTDENFVFLECKTRNYNKEKIKMSKGGR